MKQGWMRFSEETTHETLPAGRGELVQALLDVLPTIGVRVTSVDRLRGTLTGVTGVSPFSLGEVLTFQVKELAPDRSVLMMHSRLKGSFNFLGGYRHQYNFMAIREAIWDLLLDGPVQARPDEESAPRPVPSPMPTPRPATAPGRPAE